MLDLEVSSKKAYIKKLSEDTIKMGNGSKVTGMKFGSKIPWSGICCLNKINPSLHGQTQDNSTLEKYHIRCFGDIFVKAEVFWVPWDNEPVMFPILRLIWQ